MSVSPAARLDLGPPRSEVSTELAALVAQRDALRDRVEAIDSEQREANERAANTSVALAELERRALAGHDVGGQRKKLEAELAKARAAAAEPWAERRAGGQQAVRDHEQQVRIFVGQHFAALYDDLAEAAATRVDHACNELLAAYHERQVIERPRDHARRDGARAAARRRRAHEGRSGRGRSQRLAHGRWRASAPSSQRPAPAAARQACRRGRAGAGSGNVSEPNLDQLRAEAVQARGLDPAAAQFLTGTTLADVEQSADDLARLIRQREQADADEREQPASDLFTRAAADKQRRRSELLGALSGRPLPERDEQGRFATGGFDGGSRTPPPPPAPSHDQTLSELFRTKAADVGRRI